MSTIAQLNDRIRGLTAEQSRLKLRISELENVPRLIHEFEDAVEGNSALHMIFSKSEERIGELENAIDEAIKTGQECQKVGCKNAEEHILAKLYKVKIHDEERQEKKE